MKRDAHYYAILALCRVCGFNKESSLIIAYASQFVDDAKISLISIENPCHGLKHDLIDDKPGFADMATCQSNFWQKTLKYKPMVNNVSAFHFVPGCQGETFTQKLRCREESPVIMSFLRDVLFEDDLIKLGLVLHAYTDTFSHQGFTGSLNRVNEIKKFEIRTKTYLGLVDHALFLLNRYNNWSGQDNCLNSIIPPYGHGQALDLPDIPFLVWAYEYDQEPNSDCGKIVEVDNRARFKRAFLNVKRYLEEYLQKHKKYKDDSHKYIKFDYFLDNLFREAMDARREENWITFLIQQDYFSPNEIELLVYDENRWLEEAFVNFDPLLFLNWKVEGVRLADNFLHSNWYGFYLAVKWYQQKFYSCCCQYGLNFPDGQK